MTRTANDVIATLTQEAGQDKDTTTAALSEARPAAIPGLKAPRRLTVVVDAIDEATEPVRLAHELAYLASEGAAVIVGARTRPDVLYALRPSRIIDLEADEYWSPRAVEEFVRRMLTTQPESPYRDNPSAATLVAREVAHRAGGSFLFARLATEVLVRRPLVADPTSASHIALSEGVLEPSSGD